RAAREVVDAQAVARKQRLAVRDRRVGRTRAVGRDVVAQRTAQPYAVGDRLPRVLSEEAVGDVARVVGYARPRRRDVAGRRAERVGGRVDTLAIDVRADEDVVAARKPPGELKAEAEDGGLLVLRGDRRERVALPALVDALLALRVVGEGERSAVE